MPCAKRDFTAFAARRKRMYYYIDGTVVELLSGAAVLDCSGVGYELNVSLNTMSQLKLGERAKLYVSESVKEDAFDLYGFCTKSEKHALPPPPKTLPRPYCPAMRRP